MSHRRVTTSTIVYSPYRRAFYFFWLTYPKGHQTLFV